jgi:hypothetical protein
MHRWPCTLVVLTLCLFWSFSGRSLPHAEAGRTHRVSIASTGAQGNLPSAKPILSADGRFIAFVSRATNLVPGDTNDRPDVFRWDVFVHDRDTDGDGVFDEPDAIATRRVSVTSTGRQRPRGGDQPSLSADGHVVAFSSEASALVWGDTNGFIDIFVHDRRGVVQAVCGDFAATIVGTPGPDVLVGTPLPDVIQGLQGNDLLRGGAGQDLLCGGAGADTLLGGADNDRLLGGPGHDHLWGGTGNDRLTGEAGADTLDGGAGDDFCGGGAQAGERDTAVACETIRNVP